MSSRRAPPCATTVESELPDRLLKLFPHISRNSANLTAQPQPPPPQVEDMGKTNGELSTDHPPISESNIYYVYTRTTEHLIRFPYTGPGVDCLERDLAVETENCTVVPVGTRVRLHYPLEWMAGKCYMIEASVDARTGQFGFGRLMVCAEGADGGPIVRYVGNFEV